MGKLIITIPTAVGWSPNETIQLTVVHRHYKITFCQKQHLFDSFQKLFHSTPQRCCLQNGFIQRSTTCMDRHHWQLRSTRRPSSMSLYNATTNRRDQHERRERRELIELNGFWNAMTSFLSLSVMRKQCARMLPWRSALWRLSSKIPTNAPICTARQTTPKTIFSKFKNNHTRESGYSSEDSIEDSLTIGLFYPQNYVSQSLTTCSMY